MSSEHNDTIGVAHNECCRCGHRWHDYPGAAMTLHACPKCQSLYWKWLNYHKGWGR